MHRCLDPPIATYLPGLVVALLLVMPLLGQQRHNGGRGALLGDDAHEFQGVLPVEPVVLWAAGTPVIVVIVVVGSVNGRPLGGTDKDHTSCHRCGVR